MLTREQRTISPGEYLNNTVNKTPTFTKSVFDNFSDELATPAVVASMLNDEYGRTPEGQALKESRDAIEIENQAPGVGKVQWAANQLGSMIGMALNPVTWFGGDFGSIGAKAAVAGAERLAPSAVSTFMRRPLAEHFSAPISRWLGENAEQKTLGEVVAPSLKTIGTFSGAMIPQAVADRYNNDTRHIDWGGVAVSMGEMGAFGLAIDAIPFTWGLLKGKINRGRDMPHAEEVDTHVLDKALEQGHITKDEHTWYQDYLAYQKDPANVDLEAKLKESGSRLINQNGHTANFVTDKAMFEILTPDDVTNLQGVVADQLSGDLPGAQRKALSDFIINNRLDYIRQKPEWLDGVRGYVEHVDGKLGSREAMTAEADRILDQHMLKGVRENMPFSQKSMLKHMRQAGFEESHISHFPLIIPENMARNLKSLRKIDEIKSENVRLRKKYERAKNQKFAKQIKENKHQITTLGNNMRSYLERMKHTDEAKADVKDWADKIERLKLENEKLRERDKKVTSGKRYLHKITENEKRIHDLESSRAKLLTPKEELIHLRERLLGKGLPKNLERSPDYHRLVDLSHAWHNAKSLLDRVHLEAQYEKQKAFRSLVGQILRIADSDYGKIANPDNVVDYLKTRIEGQLKQVEPVADSVKAQNESQKVPADPDTVLKDQAENIRKIDAEAMKEDYQNASDRFKEFKKSDGIFKNLIACVMGGLGG